MECQFLSTEVFHIHRCRETNEKNTDIILHLADQSHLIPPIRAHPNHELPVVGSGLAGRG